MVKSICVNLFLFGLGFFFAIGFWQMKHRKNHSPNQDIDFQRMIDGLVNNNLEPAGGQEPDFSPDYDFAEQRRIHKLIETLLLNADDALSSLIAGLDRKEYSYTCGMGQGFRNLSVGEVCEFILQPSIMQCYKLIDSNDISADPREWDKVYRQIVQKELLPRSPEFKAWISGKERPNLLDLQIEALEYSLEQLKKNDRDKNQIEEYFQTMISQSLRSLKQEPEPWYEVRRFGEEYEFYLWPEIDHRTDEEKTEADAFLEELARPKEGLEDDK